nr:MAG TPA: hypothetical protein [Caudoviricetes sp.]
MYLYFTTFFQSNVNNLLKKLFLFLYSLCL